MNSIPLSVPQADGTYKLLTYDALCLKEPWLELIMLGIKTLETRTKCMRRASGLVLLTSSQEYDEVAWHDPHVGGRLDKAAKQRALNGLGKFAGLVDFGGFRPGVSSVDDDAACIKIAMSDGRTRFVASVLNPRRVKPDPTVRIRPNGQVVFGAKQGFFRVPRSTVGVL